MGILTLLDSWIHRFIPTFENYFVEKLVLDFEVEDKFDFAIDQEAITDFSTFDSRLDYEL